MSVPSDNSVASSLDWVCLIPDCIVSSLVFPVPQQLMLFKYIPYIEKKKKNLCGNSLAVQLLGFRALNAEGPGSIPGWGTKIPQATQRSQKKNFLCEVARVKWASEQAVGVG